MEGLGKAIYQPKGKKHFNILNNQYNCFRPNISPVYRQDAVLCLVTHLCLTLCDPVDCSLPGSSVHGDSPGKNTGMGCHAPSRGSSQPRSPTMQMESLPCPPVSIVIYTWQILSSTELNRFSTVGIHRAVISNTDCGSLKEKYSI